VFSVLYVCVNVYGMILSVAVHLDFCADNRLSKDIYVLADTCVLYIICVRLCCVLCELCEFLS